MNDSLKAYWTRNKEELGLLVRSWLGTDPCKITYYVIFIEDKTHIQIK